MKTKSSLLVFSLLLCTTLCAQVTTSPSPIANGYTGQIIVTFNPNQGNGGMKDATKCYAHTGLITSESKDDADWKYTFMTWRDENSKTAMTKNQDGTWKLVIDNMYSYYGCPTSTTIKKLAFVFNDGKSGSKEGKATGDKDILVTVEAGTVDLKTTIDTKIGDYVEQNVAYSLVCNATEEATMTLYVDGVAKATQKATTMTVPVTFTEEKEYAVKLVATTDTKKDSVTVKTNAIPATVVEARPAGIKMGVNIDSKTNKVTFCTFAAGCKNPNDPSDLEHARAVYLVGTFGSTKQFWTLNEDLRMKRDGNYFWMEKSGLTVTKEYQYQFAVVRADGKMVRISDLYSTRVKEGISGADGYASMFQIQQTPYQWSEASLNFQRPNKNNLIIYELWVYDHTSDRSLKGLLSRMDYFSELGVNCIELMPVNEFDGDQSWGYSPNHYFAVDNFYNSYRSGSKTITDPNLLKAFVDSCHSRGIAVVLDMVLNHATGNNPMNKLYDGDELKYNPWFNTNPPHGDNVFQDWNHDFPQTHQMMKDVLAFWMDEYKVDGYRLDLSHGLCGKSYNAVANLTDYYNSVVKPRGGYMMLEHWGSNMGSDRPTLVNAGMMCWENTTQAFLQTAEGWLNNGDDLSNANKDNYVSYPENHDEERTMAAAKMWGAGNLKTSEQARAARVPLTLGFQCMLNGPQLFYHYTEQGFEIGKFQNASGSIGKKDGGEECAYNATTCDDKEYKMDPKNPFLYKWTSDTSIHMQAMREVGKIIRLRTRYLPEVFAGNPTTATLTSGQKLRKITWGNNVTVAGNFSATDNQTYYPPSGTTWYDYLAGGVNAQSSYTLKPGEIVILTGKKISPTPTALESVSSSNPSAPVQKILKDGQIYILIDGVPYNLLGSPLSR